MKVRDREIVEAASAWLESLGDTSTESGIPTIAALIEIINDLDKQLTETLALLERAVVLDESEYEFDDVAWNKFIADAKVLLKEVKEVKDE